MWDRLRAATVGGAGGGAVSAHGSGSLDPSPHALQGRDSSSSSASRLDWKGTASSPFSPASKPSSNPNNSWQPRSSVIAARQRGQQRQASLDSGAYHFAGKVGPPPPRPLREFSENAPAEHPSQDEQFHPPPRSRTLPVPSTPTAQHNGQHQSGDRPPSSVYSQPSPLHTNFPSRRQPNNAYASMRQYSRSPDEVSPPSSPELERVGHIPNHDISPIDEEDDLTAPAPYSIRARPEQVLRPAPDLSARATLPSQRGPNREVERDHEPDLDREVTISPQLSPRHNIPLRRRERRAQRDAEAAASRMRPQDETQAAAPFSRPRTTSRDGDKPRGQRNPRWDPMTGEVTVSDKGRPSQVKPMEYARGLGISTMASHTPVSTHAKKDREQQPLESRARNGVRPGATAGGLKMSNTDPAATAFTGSSRPGWRGPSGRTAIVDPVKDDTEVAPLQIPARSTKRSLPSPGATEPIKSNGDGSDGGVTGLLSPPISPETQTREQPFQMGGGGSAGKSQASFAKAGLGLANTLRRIMPSSSSPASSASAQQNKKQVQTQAQAQSQGAQEVQGVQGVHGYPSPPLSGNTAVRGVVPGPEEGSAARATVLATVGTPVSAAFDSLVRTKASSGNPIQPSDANASNIANVNASFAPASAPAPAQHAAHHHTNISGTLRLPSGSGSESGQSTPTTIRRKEVASPILAVPLSNQSPHKPSESFSSSVYSRPDDNDDELHRANSRHHLGQLQSSRQPPNNVRLDIKNLPTLPGASNDSNSPYAQPPSRFSVTTYATSANTSRASLDADAPPLPTPPKELVLGAPSYFDSNPLQKSPDMMNTIQSSVLERSRPEMRGGVNKWDEPEAQEEPVKISLSKAWMTTAGANSAGINAQNSPPRTRKDPPKGPRDLLKSDNKENEKTGGTRGFGFSFLGPRSPPIVSDTNSNSSRPASIMSNMDKDLPPAPTLAPASATTTGDRINQLNSLLQDLANRRLNINRAIRQMTELMPQDNLMLPNEVRRKREAEKLKIEELNLKLADIGREEHDLGMKLHRAYKKLDQQTEYEPTTLWVRRATGS